MKPVKTTPKPPKWARSFLRWFCKPELLEHIEGDLEESFESHLEQQNSLKPEKQLKKAQWQYVIEVLMLCLPRIVRVPSFFSGFIEALPTFRKKGLHVLCPMLQLHGL